MTDAEKKLLQAQHRLEEAQARDRVKERKARTRRLIQEGAILEKVLPEVRTMEPSAQTMTAAPPQVLWHCLEAVATAAIPLGERTMPQAYHCLFYRW